MPEAYRQAIFDSLYRAMRETFNVPEDDQFMTIREHDAANFRYGVLSWQRSERRSRADPDHREQHPHRGTEESAVPADRGAARRKPGIRPEDVFGHGPRAIRLMRCDVPNAVHPPAAG